MRSRASGRTVAAIGDECRSSNLVRGLVARPELGVHDQVLDLLARPVRLAQQLQRRVDARVALEALDIDSLGTARSKRCSPTSLRAAKAPSMCVELSMSLPEDERTGGALQSGSR